MSLYDILTDTPSLNVTINGGQLVEAIDEAIRKAKQEFTPKKEEEYITISEASKKLDVDRSTLWRWAKSGYLKPIEIGGKRKYRASDIEKILGGK